MKLAGKLCFRAGILDVEAWMNSLDGTRILDWWEVFETVEPIGNEAIDHIVAVQTAHLHAAITRHAQSPDKFRAFPTGQGKTDKTAKDEISQFESD